MAGQKRALEVAVAGASLPAVLDALATALEDVFDQRLRVSILLLDHDGHRLRHASAPSLPDAYTRAIDGLEVGPDAGSCGTAAFTRRPVIVADLATDPLWDRYRTVALAHGLRACWSTPILAVSGNVLGTFAVYATEARWPTAAERAALDLLAHTAALVVERDRSQARDRFLIALDDEVRPLVDAGMITATTARALGRHLGVNRCAYATVEPDENTFELTGNYTAGTHDIVGRYAFSQFGRACLAHMRAGAPWTVCDTEVDPRISPDVRPAYRATSIRAVICVPVRKSDRLVAAMAVHTTWPRDWTASEVELVQQVASRSWESIERARLTRTLHDAWEREQRARAEADRERERAEAANRAKDEFLAMLGHELRNPLSPIRTALQLMHLRGSEAVERERTVIERQVQHLTRLVDDLLDVSRIARGKVDLRFEAVVMQDVVRRALEVTSPLLEERGHHLAVDLPRAPLVVHGDPTRLDQVVGNLLTNAAKYTPQGGHIRIELRHVADEVTLLVEDTGVGIAAETLPHVFDVFVQERQASDRSRGGLGLGLTIARSLVERHGGRIEARSEGPGRGSTFEIRLPIRHMPPSATATARLPAAAAETTARRRVLVVDDNEDGAAMLAAVLTARGHDVRVAHDAPEALREARVFHPEIALLDIGLPVMDGHELAVKLRQTPGLEAMTIVAVTGYGQQTDRARTRAAGFNHHLVKPVDLEAVDRVLR